MKRINGHLTDPILDVANGDGLPSISTMLLSVSLGLADDDALQQSNFFFA